MQKLKTKKMVVRNMAKEKFVGITQQDLKLLLSLEEELKEKQKALKELETAVVSKILSGTPVEHGLLVAEVKEGKHNVSWKERSRELFSAIPIATKKSLGLCDEFKDQEERWVETDRTPNGKFNLSVTKVLVSESNVGKLRF